MSDLLRRVVHCIYRIPILGVAFRKLIESHRGQMAYQNAGYWNESLKGRQRSYLGGTLSMDLRDSITVLMAKQLVPNATSMLDLGCAGATLALRLGSQFKSYWGVDISDVAICKAKENLRENRRNPTIQYNLDVAKVQEFQPSRRFDIIVFNEILYYLSLKQVEAVIAQYARFLAPGGLIVVSLKEDEVSRLVQSVILQTLKFEYGTLYQQQPQSPRWNTTRNRETPAYLVQAFSVIDKN